MLLDYWIQRKSRTLNSTCDILDWAFVVKKVEESRFSVLIQYATRTVSIAQRYIRKMLGGVTAGTAVGIQSRYVSLLLLFRDLLFIPYTARSFLKFTRTLRLDGSMWRGNTIDLIFGCVSGAYMILALREFSFWYAQWKVFVVWYLLNTLRSLWLAVFWGGVWLDRPLPPKQVTSVGHNTDIDSHLGVSCADWSCDG